MPPRRRPAAPPALPLASTEHEGPRSTAPVVRVYTDGACSGNPGPGGWAAIVVRGEHCEELGGFEPATTNNRMEMQAALEGLRRCSAGDRVHVVTDSRYLHDGISKWIHGWKRKGWKKADGDDVLNRDLWEDLDRAAHASGLKVTWEHVRGHAGHVMNERCDAIATAFARGGRPKLGGGGKRRCGVAPEATAEPPAAPPPRTSRFPLYASLVDGSLATHATWAECAARVRGKEEALHRKAADAEEFAAVLAEWGFGRG